MKIISLNTWGGRLHEEILEFFRTHKDIDIFCLQEVFLIDWKSPLTEGYEASIDFSLYTEIRNILTDHRGLFGSNKPRGLCEMAMFVREGIEITEQGSVTLYKGKADHTRVLQYVEVKKDDEKIIIAHVHGFWIRGSKLDTPERLEQSRIIKKFIDSRDGKKILCGDFNLLPNTESIIMLEAELKNLIKEYKITSTRTSYYTKTEDTFADYIFVSPDLEVKDFKVLPEEVSDHTALLLEI